MIDATASPRAHPPTALAPMKAATTAEANSTKPKSPQSMEAGNLKSPSTSRSGTEGYCLLPASESHQFIANPNRDVMAQSYADPWRHQCGGLVRLIRFFRAFTTQRTRVISFMPFLSSNSRT